MAGICSVFGCNKPTRSKGFCKSHYRFFTLYGDPTARRQVQFHNLSVEERLLKRTTKTSSCWLWVGSRDVNGYGRLNVDGVPQLVHRISWIVANGDIPAGMNVLHKCDVPSCLNPEHLFVGSQADNVRDMHEKGRDRKRGMIGSTHNMAKLTEADIPHIRRSTESSKILAERFNVSARTIYEIKNRKTWKHV